MNSSEIEKELSMSYSDLVGYLLEKYGKVGGDYFLNESCRSKNAKIRRTAEGLIVHHIDEDKAIMLSDTRWAIANPFEYQKADRLVYCNIMEHLILHIKIVEEPKPKGANALQDQGIGGAINFICPQLNSFYNGYEFKREFERKEMELIADNFEDYIKVLRYLWIVIENNPKYSFFITKDRLTQGIDKEIVDKVYDEL